MFLVLTVFISAVTNLSISNRIMFDFGNRVAEVYLGVCQKYVAKIFNGCNSLTVFSKRAPSQTFDGVLKATLEKLFGY